MERILPNGIRCFIEDTQHSFSQICLIVPVGENHEGSMFPQCAHACEHFCSAFNGGFEKPYGFLEIRSQFSVQYQIATYEDYTMYYIYHIPNDPQCIHQVIRFINGVFSLNVPSASVADRELAIIQSESRSASPNEGLMWASLYWIRQGDGIPTAEALTHRGVLGLTKEKVYTFHRQFYIPSQCVVRIIRPSSAGTMWDRQIQTIMTSSASLSFFGTRPSARSPFRVAGCKNIQGFWKIPSSTQFLIITVFLAGSPERSQTLAKSLISSSTRITGSQKPEEKSLIDILRRDLGISYAIKGSEFRMNDMGNPGCLVVFSSILSRHMTQPEVEMCKQSILHKLRTLPSRGDISNLVAKIVTHTKSDIVKQSMKSAGIPIQENIHWSVIYNAHKSFPTNNDTFGVVFSSPV